MTNNEQKQLGITLWNIAEQLRSAMNADGSQELDARKSHKKGLMPRLFPSPEEVGA